MPRRRLSLAKETLVELAPRELAVVAGAEVPPTRDCYTAGLQCQIRQSLERCNVPTVLPEMCIQL